MSWLFGSSRPAAEVAALSPPAAEQAASTDKCPVDHATRSRWLDNQDKMHGQQTTSHPFAAAMGSPIASTSGSTAKALSTERETSSIPRYLSTMPAQLISDPSTAASPSGADPPGKWVYPSPAQFYSALERKDRNPRAEDMNIVVPIHNAVNERTWQQVMAWEDELAAGGRASVQLVSFKGRPNDRTPKAWWKILLGYQAPFDRHDWIIDRDGTRRRYVIDFYTGRGGNLASLPNGEALPPSLAFYLDVRPALDDLQSISLRIRHGLKSLFGSSANK